jgi:hypothetical protein
MNAEKTRSKATQSLIPTRMSPIGDKNGFAGQIVFEKKLRDG